MREQPGKKRIRWRDAQRRRLAEKAKAIGRSALAALGTVVTPDTLLRWYRSLVAAKYDGSKKRGPGRPCRKPDIAKLVIRMAEENPSWGYTRLRGALFNLGQDIARNTIKAILKELSLRRNADAIRVGTRSSSRILGQLLARTASPWKYCEDSGWFGTTSSSYWTSAVGGFTSPESPTNRAKRR